MKRITIYLLFLGLFSTALLVPLPWLVIYDAQGNAIYRKWAREGMPVVLSHVNSIYDARVDEILELKGDSLVLKDVQTKSYGVKEYYQIADGITIHAWKNIHLYSGADRDFTLTIDGRAVEVMNEYKNTHLSIQVLRINLLRLAINGA